jgi:hypothetical protein
MQASLRLEIQKTTRLPLMRKAESLGANRNYIDAFQACCLVRPYPSTSVRIGLVIINLLRLTYARDDELVKQDLLPWANHPLWRQKELKSRSLFDP